MPVSRRVTTDSIDIISQAAQRCRPDRYFSGAVPLLPLPPVGLVETAAAWLKRSSTVSKFKAVKRIMGYCSTAIFLAISVFTYLTKDEGTEILHNDIRDIQQHHHEDHQQLHEDIQALIDLQQKHLEAQGKIIKELEKQNNLESPTSEKRMTKQARRKSTPKPQNAAPKELKGESELFLPPPSETEEPKHTDNDTGVPTVSHEYDWGSPYRSFTYSEINNQRRRIALKNSEQ